MTAMVAILVAGPAISRTRAAPGANPFINKTAAMGMDPVAHIYNGTEAAIISSMARYSLVIVLVKKSPGIRTESNAATSIPITNHLEISWINSTNPYLNNSFTDLS